MALTGTLEDFGIAEILQLIAQQSKSGVLHLTRGNEQIHVAIADGCVVAADDVRRAPQDRLGELLVRAEILSRGDLQDALEAQRRTLRRLGDILVERDLVSAADMKEMTALQTTETVYRLFEWKKGTYSFEAGAVEWDPGTATPLRADALLLEGFRQLDEWPTVRKKISSPLMTFRRTGKLDDPARVAEAAALGASERRVFALAEPGRTVDRIIGLSRLGSFETSKALLALVNVGWLEPIATSRRASGSGVSAYARDWGERLRRGAVGLAVTLAMALLLSALAWLATERSLAIEGGQGTALQDAAAQRFLARSQLVRLSRALEVWRLEHGSYPERLGQLVEDHLVAPPDLRYPFRETYYYARHDDGRFVLLPPLP